MLSDATLAYGEDAVRALLGIDAVYRAEAKDGEGLAVLNMSTTHVAEPFSGYDDARARFMELRGRAAELPEPDRRLYYRQLCDSTLAVIRWRTEGLPFSEQLSGFLHVPALPVADVQIEAMTQEMRTQLNAMGYDGDLSAQCNAWQAANRVEPEAVAEVLTQLFDQAWERTDAVLPIPADRSDGMRVGLVRDAAFNARCDYLNRTVELNVDPVLTHQGLKHLAVHEGYPGHYVQFKLRETWYREGTAAADGLLSVVNTASSSPFEGIADNGLRVIDWIESDDDRLHEILTRYHSAIGTGAAWRLHAEHWPIDRVERWLQERALVGGSGWAANRLRFIGAAHRSTLIWSYWHGVARVTPVWERTPVARRGEFLRYLYGRMHSVDTVGMFE